MHFKLGLFVCIRSFVQIGTLDEGRPHLFTFRTGTSTTNESESKSFFYKQVSGGVQTAKITLYFFFAFISLFSVNQKTCD